VPAAAVVKDVKDFQILAKDIRLVIKDVVYKGKRKDLEEVRKVLPSPLADRLLDESVIEGPDSDVVASKKVVYSDEEQNTQTKKH